MDGGHATATSDGQLLCTYLAPNVWYISLISFSSCGVQCPFLMPARRWPFHRSRHCFAVRPLLSSIVTFVKFADCEVPVDVSWRPAAIMSSFKRASSCDESNGYE